MSDLLQTILTQFSLPEGAATIAPYGSGHINDTYLLVIESARGQRRFIVQRLNKFVFKRPDQVMMNIQAVTSYLADIIRARSGDPERETLTLVPTRSGNCYYKDETGDFYRIYLFVERTMSFNLPDTTALFEKSAISFGEFQKQLKDFPADTLHETIKDFHNTPARFQQLLNAITEDRAGRKKSLEPDIEFALRYRDEVRALIDAKLPLRVTHNDTKLNNVLLDDVTGEGVCVIDLDTVMPGLSAYDFGDSIRFGGNTAAEDEENLEKVKLNLPMFEAYARGYLSTAGKSLTKEEIEMLPMGAKLMTLECGLRFLADHLNGDVYFKVHKPDHNLIRARNQFALVKDMERCFPEMQRIIQIQANALNL